MFSDLDNYLFKQGTHYELYRKLGAHPAEEGFHVAVWAPHAEEVSLLCDANGWDPGADKLSRSPGTDVFEADVPNAREGQCKVRRQPCLTASMPSPIIRLTNSSSQKRTASSQRTLRK